MNSTKTCKESCFDIIMTFRHIKKPGPEVYFVHCNLFYKAVLRMGHISWFLPLSFPKCA